MKKQEEKNKKNECRNRTMSCPDKKIKDKNDENVGAEHRSVQKEEKLKKLEDCDLKEKIIEINIDYKDMYFRAIADLDNYKRRVSTEQESNRKMAKFYVISEFLSLYNNLKQAESFIPKDVEKENWVIGIKMIADQFEKKISEMGVEAEHTVGKKFNHDSMEAINVENDDSKEEELVLREISPCYKMDGIVIEHAKVIVNKL